MFGKNPKMPTPPAYVPPSPYQASPAYQNPDPSRSNLNMFIPQVATTADVMSQAGMPGVNPDLSNYGTGWLSLKKSPLSLENMRRAEQNYKQLEVAPGIAQLEADLQARGQGGSSYAGAAVGQEAAMGNLLGFNAGLNQNQLEYQNAITARNALYGQGISLAQQQNQAGVNRAFGIAGLDYQNNARMNQYGQNNAAMENEYNIGANNRQNQYNQLGFSNQMGQYGIQQEQAQNRARNIMTLGGGLFSAFAPGGIGRSASSFAGNFGQGVGQGIFSGGNRATRASDIM